MPDESQLIGTMQSGPTCYNRYRHGGHEYAVVSGKTLDDREFVYGIKLDKSSGEEYFVNVHTRDKSWSLPVAPLLPSDGDLLSVPDEVLANPWRARFIAFYEKYSPDRIPFIDPTLLQHPGREAVLMKALVRKYGPEPGHEDEYESTMNENGDFSQPASPLRDVSTYRQRVVAIIQHYKPSKLPLVDKYMEKYVHQEEELIQFLINKFGPEPSEESGGQLAFIPAQDTVLADKGVMLRESALMGFLQDREARLEAALSRNADLSAELSALREQNEGLLKEARDLRGVVESESRRVEGDLLRVQNANAVALQHWEVERTKLISQLESESTASEQALTSERLKFQQAGALHFKEKGALLEDFQRNREELDFCQRKTSELLNALDRKEIAILKLQKDHEAAMSRLNATRVSSSCQTAGEDVGDTSPFALMTVVQQDATAALQTRIQFLEETIHRIRFDCQQHSHISQQLQSKGGMLDSLAGSPSASSPMSPMAMQSKLSNAHATIAALRSMNKGYEERIATLEMKLLSQPPSVQRADGADADEGSPGLRDQLAVSEATVKAQRREINDLRGLLARYMSMQKKKSERI